VCPNPERPPVACELEQTYADEVVAVDQGLRKNGTPVLASRSDTDYALGAPQSAGTPYDSPVVANSFFSLGFPLQDHAAEIVLSFNDNYVVNGPGADLKLWEVTGGTSYPDEQVDVYVGNTPTGPWTQVGFGVTRDAEIELGAVSAARYVRIVDASNIGLFESTADGYDLDAVQALNCVVSPIGGGPAGGIDPVQPTVTPGEATMDEGGGVHYLSFANSQGQDAPDEVVLGADIQLNPKSNEQDILWLHDASNSFSFEYATDTDQLKTTVNDNPELTWDDISTNAQCPVGDWDVLQLSMKGEQNDTIDIENLVIDGVAFGNLAGSATEAFWTFTGLTLSDGFTVSGDIVVTAPVTNNGDGNNVKILVGCSA
jgi:hypothetical protein